MRRLLGWCALVLLAGSIYAVDTPYSCSGTVPCDSSCETSSVSCTLAGTVEGSTSCKITSDGKSITCIVKQGDQVVAKTETDCLGCETSGEPDPGEGCDSTLPTYWVFCDPFDV